jgi:L-ascorbate metabolism protein UlaG (beta-lactamase superfamily)
MPLQSAGEDTMERHDDLGIFWLGHGTFLVQHGAQRLLLDAWVESNPACPPAWHRRIRDDGLDAILITHTHEDHVGDLAALARDTGAPVLGQVDWAPSLQQIDISNHVGFNRGGTVHIGASAITMTAASHSTSAMLDGRRVTLGSEAGYVITLADGRTIYHAGDTAVSAEMQVIGELYRPEIAILPIGDHYTMGPRQAAFAARLLGARIIIPGHYGTFPLLHGTPAALVEHLAALGVVAEVCAPAPGGRAL